jgi:hypothetical protein
MGQYYLGAILNKNIFKTKNVIVECAYCPFDFNNGAKLMEHSYVGNHYVMKYENALANKYYGHPFVWIGDYADNVNNTNVHNIASSFADEHKCKKSNNKNTYKYIINLDKKQFIRIPKKNKGEFIIHPLPLLCADGNGRGGGDYDGTNMELIGIWAYDRIGISDTIPDDIKEELIASFLECYDGGDSEINDYKVIPYINGEAE